MKKISDLIPCDSQIMITGVTDDSRRVKEGYLFVATKGLNVDHYDYIMDAIEKGCSFVICEREISISFPHLIVDNIFDVFLSVCKKFYDVDFDSFHFIGITGTDGKTTTATILQQLIDSSSYLGTNGFDVMNQHFDTSNTTPCVEELYYDISLMRKYNSSVLCMEVSSEALLHKRISGISYDIVGFTNITGDHLNVHKTFLKYVECKKQLLSYVKKNGFVVVNGDDPILSSFSHPNIISFGFLENNDCRILSVSYLSRSCIITLEYQKRIITITSPFIGKHNVYNVVMAYLIASLYGIDESLLLERIKELRPIKGRCEFLDFGQKYDIILDYAHTIHGIQSIVECFRNYSNIIVVTGCAGGRDSSKRAVIGEFLMKNADVCIFTMDDPRYEDVNDIIDDMVGEGNHYYRIIDREDAICYALSIAKEGDVVLVLGKGRDSYMAIRDKKIHYSDYDVIYHFFHS